MWELKETFCRKNLLSEPYQIVFSKLQYLFLCCKAFLFFIHCISLLKIYLHRKLRKKLWAFIFSSPIPQWVWTFCLLTDLYTFTSKQSHIVWVCRTDGNLYTEPLCVCTDSLADIIKRSRKKGWMFIGYNGCFWINESCYRNNEV